MIILTQAWFDSEAMVEKYQVCQPLSVIYRKWEMDILDLLLSLVVVVVVFYLHLSESELTLPNGNVSTFFVLSAKMAST